MQISSRFTLAVHIFTCIDTFQNEYKVTSDFIAGSTNVNPVIIRKILLQLKAAGLVQVARGTGGTTITTCNNHLIHIVGIGCQHNLHITIWTKNLDRLGLVTDIRNTDG